MELNKNMLFRFFTFFFLIIAISINLSCGEQELTVSGNNGKSVPLKINIVTPDEEQTSQTDFTTAQLEDFIQFVRSIRVSVGSSFFSTFVRTFPVGEPIVLFVPPGTDITFIVSLLNDIGNAICTGQTTTDIFPDVVNQITVTCIPNTEICNNNEDDNGDTLVDCEESTCAGSQCDPENSNSICLNGECTSPPPAETDCSDGIDNDADSGEPNGGTDCEDLDCSIDPACVETVCDDGIDNDGDGNTDCDDLDCGEEDVCDEICDDNIDNDLDGAEDCQDAECNNQDCGDGMVCQNLQCISAGEMNCSNDIDDDGDNLTDCADIADCENRTCFTSGSVCDQGVCTEVACSDGVNNDNDTLFGPPATDCVDSDCEGAVCGTGSGAICDFFGEGGECMETNCTDGIDNDQDESTDCLDSFDCPCPDGQFCSQQTAQCEILTGKTE